MGKKCEAPGCEREARSRFKDGPQVCGMHYQRLLAHGTFDLPMRPKKIWATCSIDGCESKSRTIEGKLCEAHYYRRRRTGSTDDPVYGRKYVASHGYVISYSPTHPMAAKSGTLYEHRLNLFNAIGGGTHQCHWCKQYVSWDIRSGKHKLVVDHLDNNKLNNEVDNLVPACHACNSSRGLFASWATKHKDDPFLLRLFMAANDNTPKLECKVA